MSNYTSVFKKKDQALSENSSMTGKNTDPESLSFIPGMKKEMKLMRIRFLILLLISNIAVAFIVNSPQEDDEVLVEKVLLDHADHIKITMPLRLQLTIPSDVNEIPISLYDLNKKQIVALAYLHPVPENETSSDFLAGEELPKHEVEIHHQDMKKIVHLPLGEIIAYPYNPNLQKQVTFKRSVPHEVQF